MRVRGFEYSDITAARKNHIAVRSSLKVFTEARDHCVLFMKISVSYVKKYKIFLCLVSALNRIFLIICFLLLFVHLHPFINLDD
jgi:hypothetical protein